MASSTSGLYTLSISKIEKLSLPLAPILEQEEIVEAVEEQLSVIDHLEGDLEDKLKSAQTLRQSILYNGFTGQLVAQDPNDEPAAELLRRIAVDREERAREVAASKRATREHAAQRRSRTIGAARTAQRLVN
jgi:type I restriction enzyme S subunit